MRVNVENNGTYEISEEHLPELLRWLSIKSGIRLKESNTVYERSGDSFTGRRLLND